MKSRIAEQVPSHDLAGDHLVSDVLRGDDKEYRQDGDDGLHAEPGQHEMGQSKDRGLRHSRKVRSFRIYLSTRSGVKNGIRHASALKLYTSVADVYIEAKFFRWKFSPVENSWVKGLVSCNISSKRFFNRPTISLSVKRIHSFKSLEHKIADTPVINIQGRIFRLLK